MWGWASVTVRTAVVRTYARTNVYERIIITFLLTRGGTLTLFMRTNLLLTDRRAFQHPYRRHQHLAQWWNASRPQPSDSLTDDINLPFNVSALRPQPYPLFTPIS